MYHTDTSKIKCCFCIVMLLSNQCIHTAAEETTEAEIVFKLTDTVFVCSSTLSYLLYRLCNNDFKIIKRDTSPMLDRMMPRSLHDHLYKQRLLSSEPWRRVRRQIVDKCCLKACSVNTFIQYCGNKTKLVQEKPDLFEFISNESD